MFIKGALVAILALLLGLGLTATVVVADDENDEDEGEGRLRTYRVTLENLTDGQPFSPPVAASHRRSFELFAVGAHASDEIEAIAEDGNQVPAFNLLDASRRVTQAVDIGIPLTPQGKVVGSFTDSVTFETSARPGDRFSLATMLICTNDAITGLDSVKLPRHGSRVFDLNAYDAGTEDNTQNSLDIVDPCTLLGPLPLDGDLNGNVDADVDTDPPQVIHHHPGIHGSGDLDRGEHEWSNPVARVTIERID